MSGRPGTASCARGGDHLTTTPLKPFGLDSGGRASDADTRDPLADLLARAESLLGRYSGDSGSTARPDMARFGMARPGTARLGTARRGVPNGSTRPSAARYAQPEVLVVDSAPGHASFADDGETETSFDGPSGSISFPKHDDDQTTAASFSLDVDASVDDASMSFGGAAGAFIAEEDSFGDDETLSGASETRADPAASPPLSCGDVTSLPRPGTAVGDARPVSAKGGPRPVSAPRSDHAFAKRATAAATRRGRPGGLGGALSAPRAGAFDGSAPESTAEADASVETLHDECDAFVGETPEVSSGLSPPYRERASPSSPSSPSTSARVALPSCASPNEEESFLLEAIRAAQRGGRPLDARAAAMLESLVPDLVAARGEGSARGAASSRGAAAKREAARGARRAFKLAAPLPRPREAAPRVAEGDSPLFSSAAAAAAAAEARALALDDSRREEAALASAAVGATGRDDWWAFLGGIGAYPGARRRGDADADATAAVSVANGRSALARLQHDASPELAWTDAARSRSFDDAMRARVASLRARLRACVARAETSRYAAKSAFHGSLPTSTAP